MPDEPTEAPLPPASENGVDVRLAAVYACPHHPEGVVERYSISCGCRKPLPGLVIEAGLDLARLYNEIYPPHMALFVGDRPEDEQCAKNLNLAFKWARDWRTMALTQE